jgi:ActR/RegA family two-component response regulator
MEAGCRAPHMSRCVRRTQSPTLIEVVGTGETRGTVLVVDDDRALLRAYGDWFRGRGCTVLAATNAEDAIELACEAEADLALVDLVLDGRSGADVIDSLKRLRPAMHVVAATGYPECETAVRAMHAGATWVYEKPPDLENVLTLLMGTWTPPPPTRSSVPTVSDIRAEYLRRVVSDRGGVSQAARHLGMRRTTLQKMLRGGRGRA